MIDNKYVERCNNMLRNEKTVSYLCIGETNDNCTWVDYTASGEDMAVMFANAAANHPHIRIALELAYLSLQEYYRGKK